MARDGLEFLSASPAAERLAGHREKLRGGESCQPIVVRSAGLTIGWQVFGGRSSGHRSMTAIYGFTDAANFAVVCADNHTPTNPVDKVAWVTPSLVVGVIGQPFAMDLLREVQRSSKVDWKVPDFATEFAKRVQSAVEWFVPAFEEERRKRETMEGFPEWDHLIRQTPVLLALLDLRDLTLHEIDFGRPLPPGRLRASPIAKTRSPGTLWRFARTAPRIPWPDVSELQRDPAGVFSKLLDADAGPGTGTVGTLVTVSSRRLVFKSVTGESFEETLSHP